MAKLQVRNFPDNIYEQIVASAAEAERSIEGELRYVLSDVYGKKAKLEEPPLSLRQSWQVETGKRMVWLLEQLRHDGWFRYGESADPVLLAARIGESSPALLLDCLEGRQAPTFDMAARMQAVLSCRADWLMSGAGNPFQVASLSGDYRKFLSVLLDDSGRLKPDTDLHFVRVCAKEHHHDGTLLMIVRSGETWHCGYEHTTFMLNSEMGTGGRGNLLRFFKYVKTELSHVPIESWIYRNTENEDPELGFHHPEYYIQHGKYSDRNDWLFRMLTGQAPFKWSMSFSAELEELEKLPFESTKRANDV